MRKKNVVVLGSTGSIGENTLDIIRQFRDKFRVVGLCVNNNIKRLEAQIKEFAPEFVAVKDEVSAAELRGRLRSRVKVFSSLDGISKLASLKEVDVVVVAIVGSEALFPLLSAIKANKIIALANKESIVVGGEIVRRELKKSKARIIPVDSEQNAIFQCLEGYDKNMVENVYLTASGGPLIDYSKSRLHNVSIEKVLAHPRWKMGKKISVDSATLMNKGLEVIEAQQLFDLELERIKVLIHRDAIVHSLVEFRDGSVLAQMSKTDMRLPIQHALTYPQRLANNRFRLDLFNLGGIVFSRPDYNKFPCLELAYEAARLGGCVPCALNAANEVAVGAFLEKKLEFGNIPKIIERVIKTQEKEFSKNSLTLKMIFYADMTARALAKQLVEFYQKKGIKK